MLSLVVAEPRNSDFNTVHAILWANSLFAGNLAILNMIHSKTEGNLDLISLKLKQNFNIFNIKIGECGKAATKLYVLWANDPIFANSKLQFLK